MFVKWTTLALLAAVRVSADELESNFNAWNVAQTKISNVKKMRPHTPEIIYINPVPMGSNKLREQNDAIAAVYGPAFLKVDWIWDGFDTKNRKYNSEHGDKRNYQNVENYNRHEMRGMYSHEIDPIKEETYKYENERNGNPDEKYNQDRNRIESELYVSEHEQNPENRNWKSQETQDIDRHYANIRENSDHHTHENKKPIFPRLHQLKINTKRVLQDSVSKIRSFLPQLKHVEEKDRIKHLRGQDDHQLGGVGQSAKERIKKIREQFNEFDTEKVIEIKPKPIETVGNRPYPGYDDPTYQQIRPEGGQYAEGGDYVNGNKEIPHGWGRGYEPAWARLPEVSFQGRYHGMIPLKITD